MSSDDLYTVVHLQGQCPQCGKEVIEGSKDTSSGRDIRYYRCSECDWWDFVDVGIALWKAITDVTSQQSRESEKPESD